MAAAQHKLSRRSLLAGACALPLARHPELVSGSSPPPPGRAASWTLKRVQGDDGARGERWRKALGLFAQAEAEVEALAHTEDDDLYGRALGRHSAALARLLRAPAPDLVAVAGKLDLLIRYHVAELHFGAASMAALRRDVVRLSAQVSS
jgi:hypothetical protein